MHGRTSPSIPPLADTLEATVKFIRKYVVLTTNQAIIITLWVAHTHAIGAADCTPYLQVTSATKRAGKTRLLEVLEPLVARPWLTGRTSAAVLVRKTDAVQPSLLLDESDAAFGSEKGYTEALRSILNTGYRRSGKASLCVKEGSKIAFRDFATFGLKAIAGIGELPGTIADLGDSDHVCGERPDEAWTRWREREGHQEATPLLEQFQAWANKDVIDWLRAARPQLPAIDDDRKLDVLEPLLAIAELAGGTWPEQTRTAACQICGSVEDADLVVELLRDVAPFIDTLAASNDASDANDAIPTKELLEHLIAQEHRPWATWRRGQPMSPHALARLLAPLNIRAPSTGAVRGYARTAVVEAIARYLPFKHVQECQD